MTFRTGSFGPEKEKGDKLMQCKNTMYIAVPKIL
jgi:hypothetical protein